MEPSAAPTVPDLRQRNKRLLIGLVGLAIVSTIVALLVIEPDGMRGRWSSGKSGGIQSLAVLPLRNLSDDPGEEYFSDGMTDEFQYQCCSSRSGPK